MIQKILAIGCSFTAGQELPDAKNTEEISEYAYPALLAKRYNASLNNLSMSGTGNHRIFRKVVNEICRQQYDLVICGWTTWERLDLQFENRDLASAIGSIPYQEYPWLRTYYKYHSDMSVAAETWLSQMITLQSFFQITNQKYIFLGCQSFQFDRYDPLVEKYQHLIDKIDATKFIGWPKRTMLDIVADSPKGPGGHPLELGHYKIADEIHKQIQNLGWL